MAASVPNLSASTGTFKPITTSTTIGAVPAATPIQPMVPGAIPTAATPGGASTQPLVGPPGGSPLISPSKEVNIASLCRHGQEMVQEIIQKTTDIFQWLKGAYPPNGTNITPAMCQERRLKLEEHIRMVNNSFQKLLLIYNKVKEYRAEKPIEEYLPIEVCGEIKGEKPRITENIVFASEEHKEVLQQIQLKNQQLKEIIDHLRMIIWEINTMMAVRRT